MTIQQIERDFGHLDIVVANAGVAGYSPAEDYTPAAFSEVMKVNLDGAFYTAQAAARIFKKQGSGNVIFTASVSAILVNIPQKQAAVSFLFPTPSSKITHIDWLMISSVQRIESCSCTSCQITSRRMGGFRSCQLHISRFHCNRSSVYSS